MKNAFTATLGYFMTAELSISPNFLNIAFCENGYGYHSNENVN